MNSGVGKEDISNYDEVKQDIIDRLEQIGHVPENYDCNPLIYHLDVAAMYPNIILTNRLQPAAIVNDKFCSGCLFNRPESLCKRPLPWVWKGDYFPLSRGEYEQMKIQIEYEHVKSSDQNKGSEVVRSFHDLNKEEQHLEIKKRAKILSQKMHKQIYVSKTEEKENTVCMRANSFYVDTIRDFRDRRYEFKNLVKVWRNKMHEFESKDDTVQAQEAKVMSIMYESLQLAYKIILNSFYGYVMRKGARWYSMEMAAMVTDIGSRIISDAKDLIDRIGKPLELDTDGIWCLLPKGFPENSSFITKTGKKLNFSYPCSMLNVLIYEKYANPQYQTLVDHENLRYAITKEMSVFFEVDGPYRAMVIPAAKEEGKVLKKRYVVYNFDGSIAEIKGFELKRRGELKLIKIFQEDLFNHLLEGGTLEECYASCGAIAERWLDILYKKGEGISDEELLDYIGESKTLSKGLGEYEKQKGVALTAAKRMSEFLGSDIVTGKLNCPFIIASKPAGAPVSERVVPIGIFGADEAIKKKNLKKWLKINGDENMEMRQILDWNYYIERLGSSIQKILTIPAALQKLKNPVPSVPNPEWLAKLARDYDLRFEQKKISSFFSKPAAKPVNDQLMDLEDMMQPPKTGADLTKSGKTSIAASKKPSIKNFLNISRSQTSNGIASLAKEIGSSQRSSLAPGDLEVNSQIANLQPQPDVCYDMDQDLGNWLKWQKGLWRAKRRGERDSMTSRKSGPKNSIGNMFRTHEEHVLSSVWHIVQICETDTPGIYRLWVYLDNAQMFSVRVKANRVFYINSQTTADNPDFKVVRKRLPRNKKALHLYERTIDEEEFINRFNGFDAMLTNPDCEGVYETKIPLDFKLICDIDPKVKLRRTKSKPYTGYQSYIFDVEELQPAVDYEKKYLVDFAQPTLVISQISIKGKLIWSVFNNHLNEYDFLVIEKNLASNDYKKIVKKILKEATEDADDLVFKINVNSYLKEEQALAHIEHILQQLKDQSRTTTYIVVLQTQYKVSRVTQLGLKSIGVLYPTLHLPAVDSSEINFSSLDWQKKGIQQLCEQYLCINEYLEELLELCRYSNIPFCNIGHDRLNFVTDVLYARLLKHANCLSWYSPTGNPEIGGGKADDAREFIPTDFIPSEVVHPSLYLDYCVEIDINLLARNAICASDELKSVEKENSAAVDFTSVEDVKIGEAPKPGDERRMGDDLDETVVCRTAFRLVKTLADSWIKDVKEYSQEFADRLLGNLQRWICDEESKFYDVILHKMLNTLMKKFYAFLLQKLKSLGAHIVYANQSKVIISTGKYSRIEAENFSEFILKTVISYPLFQHISLSPKTTWRIFLLKDKFNFGGIFEDGEQGDMDLQLSIVKYLPSKFAKHIISIVAGYLRKVSKYMDKVTDGDAVEVSVRIEEFREKVANFSGNYITKDLSYRLFESIPDWKRSCLENQIRAAEIQSQLLEEKKRKEDLDNNNRDMDSEAEGDYSVDEEDYAEEKNINQEEIEEWEFPKVFGRIPEYKNGVLEFIKFLCHVLNFDERIQDEVVILKRNCLKVLGISDFAEESKYIEPSRSIVLNDIYCKYCSNVIEIDLFKDETFRQKNFNCPSCEARIDERRLETKIIKLLKQYVIFYQIQDLYCSKCKMAKSELFEGICRCSGRYVMREDTPAYGFKLEQSQLIRSFEELAMHCDFSLLQDYLLELKFDKSLSI